MDLVVGLGGVLGVAHGFLYWRLVWCTGSARRWRIGGAVLLASLYGAAVASLAVQRYGPGRGLTGMHAVGMTWLGAVIYLALVLALLDVPVTAARIVGRLRGRRRSDRDARRRTSRATAIVASVVAACVVGYGIAQAVGPVRTVHARIVIPALPRDFDGFRIAVVTDLHLGPLLGRSLTRHVVDSSNREKVDVVALVGDLSDGRPGDLLDAVAPLADLRAREGVYFTTGNHEYYFDAPAWQDALPALSITVLDNEARTIVRGGSRLLLAGVSDDTGGHFGDGADLDRALVGRLASDTVVLLAHQPRQVAAAAAAGVALQLSGHTHGGQIWPFHLPTRAQQGTLAGLSAHGGTRLWTSRGAGYWGPPLRVGAPSDISVLTLARGGAAD